jgi:type II secretory pathway pseudopilin PulG
MWSNRGVAKGHVAEAGTEPGCGRAPGRQPDEGVTLIELLVVIVLLATVIASVLSLVTTTIRSSSRTRDSANAQAVLSTASDLVTSTDNPRLACTPTNPPSNYTPTNKAAIIAAYQTAIQNAGPPYAPDWIVTVTDVKFWDGTVFGANCYEGNNLPLQLVTIRAMTPNGHGDETIEVVKGDV